MNSFRGKRVLITGATGLIGSHLVRYMLKEGANVIAYGRNDEKLKKVFKKELDKSNLQFVVGNIAQKLDESIGTLDFIFHAASPISGVEIKTKPVDTIAANLQGTLNCLEYLKKQRHGRMIVFSSATVYGNQNGVERCVTEKETEIADELHTLNTPYSESKRMIEVLARAYAMQYEVDVVIARIGYVYGYINPSPNTAFYEFVEKSICGENITLNSSGQGRRDNIHVIDVVNGLCTIAANGIVGEAYNISSNGEKNNYRAIDEIAEIIAKSINDLRANDVIKVIIGEKSELRRPGLMLNNQKLKKLGWEVSISLEEGIKDTISRFIDENGDIEWMDH